jgi:hypothetical protein
MEHKEEPFFPSASMGGTAKKGPFTSKPRACGHTGALVKACCGRSQQRFTLIGCE